MFTVCTIAFQVSTASSEIYQGLIDERRVLGGIPCTGSNGHSIFWQTQYFHEFSRLDALTVGGHWTFRPVEAHCQCVERLYHSGEPCAELKSSWIKCPATARDTSARRSTTIDLFWRARACRKCRFDRGSLTFMPPVESHTTQLYILPFLYVFSFMEDHSKSLRSAANPAYSQVCEISCNGCRAAKIAGVLSFPFDRLE